MKKFLLIATLFLLWPSDGFCATLYLRDDATTWTSAASWSNVSAVDNTNSGPPTAADDCIAELLSSNVTISATAVCKSFSTTAGTGNWAGTLTHDAGINWTVSGSITFNSGITYTPTATSTVTLAATNTLTTAGKLFPLMVINTGITTTLGDNLSFIASKVITLTLNGNSLDINGNTVSGNSATNRVLIRSNTLGTARTITTTTGTFDAADFRDITASTAVDLSGATNFAGDCGGNTNITFTTAATQTATGNSANWSTTTWTSRVPLPQDDVVLSLTAGQTLTNDMPRMGKSISVTTAMNLSTNTIAQTLYGSLDLTNVSTFTVGSTGTWTFEGRGSFSLTSNAKSFVGANVTINMVGGTLTLNDAFATGSILTITQNSFDNSGNFNVTALTITSAGSNTGTITMGNGTWSATGGTTQTVWNMGASTTLVANSSTIALTSTSTSNKTFAGGGKTYNDVLITGGGTGDYIFTGANTFNRIYTDGGGTKDITLPGSTTTTILSSQGLANGSNIITFTASSGSATVAKSGGGTVEWSPVNLTNIIASTANTWYAGPAPPSVDGGGNTNWIFQDAPSGESRGRSDRLRFIDDYPPRHRMIV